MNSNWNNHSFANDLARNVNPELRKKVLVEGKLRKTQTVGWEKGDRARFSNGVIGKVTRVNPTSLMIRIGLGKPQKYSPKMVNKIEK